MAEDAVSRHARREVFRTLGRALWRFRYRTLAALALLIVAKLLMVAVPVVLKVVVDRFSDPSQMLVLPVFLLVGYALLRFAGGIFTELRDMVFVRVAQTTVAGFSVRLFEHLHRLGARFHGGRQTGVLARDVERGTGGLAFLLGSALFTLLPTLVEMVAVVAIMVAAYSVAFAGIVGVTFLLYAIVTVVFTARRTVFLRQLNELDSAAGGRLVDSLLNYDAVKFYNSEAAEARRLRTTLERWVEVGVDNQRALSALHVAQSGIIALGVAAVMLLAGQEVVLGNMTVGDLVLVNAYIIQICLPLAALGMVFRQAKEALVNAERACSLLQVRPEIDDSEALPALELGPGAVRFEHVDFGYEPGRQVLWDVSFEVPPGKTVAVVGGSGSGKSTLGRLLFRFYDPDAGRVLVDGQDVRTISPASLRAALGIVPQDTILFNDTIAYNIAYGRPGASLSEVIEAAQGARVHDFIQSLPMQYDTIVGERGVKLSGGERQRIAIARALLKNPPVLLFDEATSALDTRTERAIQAELDRISQNRTTLVIAHRLSTVVNADMILVLEQGRIVERGTHKELLAAKGIYAQMWNLQRQQNELEDVGTRLSLQPVNLATLVAGVLDAARPMIEDRGVALYTQIGLESARVTGNPAVLQQLVWDLCLNAVAATAPGGRMELALTRAGAMVRLSVTDGRLAPADAAAEAAALAARFPDEPPLAAGIPAIDVAEVQLAVEKFGGAFGSGHVGNTSRMRYWLELPLRAPAAPRSPAPHAAHTATLHDVRIALVDDEPEMRERIRNALEADGAQVRPFAAGEDFLAELRRTEAVTWPQLLVCDISLGAMDGYRVVTTLRELEAERGIDLARRMPAIALSAHGAEEGRLRALLAGFQVHVPKPLDEEELLARVRGLVQREGGREAGGD